MNDLKNIQNKIYTIRGVRVMLDRDLAELYEVETKTLNQAIKRNALRFPEDFMFQLSSSEWKSLRSQIVTSKKGRGGIRYMPHVFTEQGVAMLSSVLNSDIAVQINIKIIRAFVEIRHIISTQPEYDLLRERIRRIESETRESKLQTHVETQLVSGKLIQLSRSVQETHQKIEGLSSAMDLFSSVLDEFEKAHIIIKRPEEGLGKGTLQ